MTLTFIAERLAVEISLPVFTTKVCRSWDSSIQPSAYVTYALTHCAIAAVTKSVKIKKTSTYIGQITVIKTLLIITESKHLVSINITQ